MKLLLHSCCAPCTTAVLEKLFNKYPKIEITLFYYNPNITDEDEYFKRLAEEKKFIVDYENNTGNHVDLIVGKYDPDSFFDVAKGLELEPEKGLRCTECFKLRFTETAKIALENGFDYFDSTLSVSYYKDYNQILEVGKSVESQFNIPFLGENYSLDGGSKRSEELANIYGLYQQDYCGCIYSRYNK